MKCTWDRFTSGTGVKHACVGKARDNDHVRAGNSVSSQNRTHSLTDMIVLSFAVRSEGGAMNFNLEA